MSKLRIVQWATGTVGKSAMRAVIGHSALELVGVFVYSEAKAGLDAGEICGLAPTGVTATRDIATILAMRPDCVLYMPDRTNLDEVCSILAGGVNIVTTRADFFNPQMMDETVRSRVEAACQKGQASIHCTGSSPGFITEALPIVLLSLQRHLDLLTIDEFANCVDGCSEEMLRETMGFGETPEVFAARQMMERDAVFAHSLASIANAIGLPTDSFEMETEVALTRLPTLLHKTTIGAGTVGGQRFTLTGLKDGEPLIRMRTNWFVTTDLLPAWDLRDDGWRVLVDGDTPLDVSIRFPMPDDPHQRQMILPRLTAHRPVNAIAAVCAAQPGIVTTVELPQIIARLD